MHSHRFLVAGMLGFGLACSACVSRPPAVEPKPEPAQEVGSFVFLGTVTKTEEKEGLVLRTVRIDDGYLQRGTFDAGKEIVVTGKEMPESGQHVFHVEPAQFGARMVATLLRAEAAKELTKDEVKKLQRVRRKQELAPLLKAAELVLVGEVTGTKAWRDERIESEHDPNFTWATIKTDESLKGEGNAEQTVLFAASDDIHWYQSPKPAKGVKAAFLLQKGLVGDKRVPAEAWTLLRPGHLLQGEDITIVRELVREGGTK